MATLLEPLHALLGSFLVCPHSVKIRCNRYSFGNVGVARGHARGLTKSFVQVNRSLGTHIGATAVKDGVHLRIQARSTAISEGTHTYNAPPTSLVENHSAHTARLARLLGCRLFQKKSIALSLSSSESAEISQTFLPPPPRDAHVSKHTTDTSVMVGRSEGGEPEFAQK